MTTPHVVFVHGSWHGPWCWDRVRAALDRAGIASSAVALPSCGPDRAAWGDLAADSAAIAAAATAAGGAVTVVAHSYGGVATSNAAFGPEVRHLVFLGAFMPDAGRSLVSYLPEGPLPPYVTISEDGTSRAVPEAVPALLYGDCRAGDAAAAVARLVPQNAAVVTTAVTGPSWARIRSTCLLLTEDLALPVPLQRHFAAQAGRTIEMAASHSPFWSRPEELAALLAEIAATAARPAMA